MTMSPLDEWKLRLEQVEHRPVALLCGAKVWPGSSHPDYRLHCARADWTTTDIEAGEGVTIVADLQTMHERYVECFDAILCPFVLEHIERPWVAMMAMGQMLRPGGLLYVLTHQTFPLHGYPQDYFRFSEQALRTLCFDAGLKVLSAGYDSPCTIVPLSERVWNPLAEAFLHVSVCARKG